MHYYEWPHPSVYPEDPGTVLHVHLSCVADTLYDCETARIITSHQLQLCAIVWIEGGDLCQPLRIPSSQLCVCVCVSSTLLLVSSLYLFKIVRRRLVSWSEYCFSLWTRLTTSPPFRYLSTNSITSINPTPTIPRGKERNKRDQNPRYTWWRGRGHYTLKF